MGISVMGHTFQSLLDQFCEIRGKQYRTDADEADARMESIEYTIQTLLEMLRDRYD